MRDVDAAFGVWKTEDHWSLIESAIPFYRGNRASFVGKDAAPTDFIVKWLDIWGTIESGYETQLGEASKAYLEAFAQGLNYYASIHPEEVSLDVLPVTAQDLVAGYSSASTLLWIRYFEAINLSTASGW